MSKFILVHGAWHGAWCWYKVVPRLERLGHSVLAPDLPACGRSRTAVNRVSLRTWRNFVCDLLDASDEPVVLVGHSRGGIVISQVAEERPEKIRRLVYVTAFLGGPGQSLFDLAALEDGSLITPALEVSADKASCTVRESALREGFYGECSEEDFALARLSVLPEPMVPFATPLEISAERYGRVPRAYIECLRDRAVPIALQRRMLAAMPCDPVLSLDTDHSPFLSRPDELAQMLDALAS